MAKLSDEQKRLLRRMRGEVAALGPVDPDAEPATLRGKTRYLLGMTEQEERAVRRAGQEADIEGEAG